VVDTRISEDCPALKRRGPEAFAAAVKSAEADNAENLDRRFKPLGPFGITRVSPVTDILEAIARRTESS